MKKFFIRFLIAFVVLLVFSVFISSPVIAEYDTITIVGEVNDEQQILTRDGFYYEIGETEVSSEVLSLAGSVIEATGF